MIHKYFLNGYYIVIDTNSGAVHIVDELAYRLLDFFTEKLKGECPDEIISTLVNEGFDKQDIIDTYAELKALCDDDSLFSEDTYRPFADMLTEAPIKSMCLNISHDCNLRCEYCFAAQGDFGHGRKLMPFEVGKAAIDFLIKHSANRHNLELDFFGGEPLMNLDVVKKVVEYARSIEKEHNKNFRFTMTTNGILLDDDSIDFINREMSNVVLSLDGRKEVNDRLRPTVNKKGSYDIIVPKYQKLVAERGNKEYYVRGTFTKYNLDFTDDVLHLNELGFDQISVEPVVTDPELPSGSDRVHVAAQTVDPDGDFDVIVNLQGDLPTLDPSVLRNVLEPLEADPAVDIATLATEIHDAAEFHAPSIVKIALARASDRAARLG